MLKETFTRIIENLKSDKKYFHPLLSLILATFFTLNFLLLISIPHISQSFPSDSPGAMQIRIYGGLCLISLLFIGALALRCRWGFYGYLMVSILTMIMNYANGIAFPNCLISLAGITILFFALFLGKGEYKGWALLE